MKVNELEDKVMGVWATCEDIDTFLYRYLDSPAGDMSEDDIANTLIGIKALHEQRCQRLWDAFEEVIKSTKEKEKEVERRGNKLKKSVSRWSPLE